MTNSTSGSDNKILVLLCYIFPIVALVLFLMEDKKNDPGLKPHIVQGLALGVVMIILSLIPVIGWIANLVVAVYAILCGIKAYQGNEVVIPYLSDFLRNQGLL